MQSECEKKLGTDILVGGQAVMEGVMMRTPRAIAVAVRRPDGSITVMKEAAPRWTDRFPWLKLPLVRGTAILIQSMILGIRALNFSAEAAMAEEPDTEPGKTEVESDPPEKSGKGKQAAVIATMIFSLALGVALFVLVPYWLSDIITKATYPVAEGLDSSHEHWLFFNLVDGVIRALFFLGYIVAISFMSDIRRVFQYHGAEHKVVHVWEAKETIQLENARKYSPLHPRCGTSFLLFVMVVSILVFTIFKFDAWYFKVLSRIALLPLVAGIAYELIRLTARFPKNVIFRAMMAPGLLLQRLTTRPPSDDQLEVSIRALQEALGLEDELTRAKQGDAA